MGNRRRLGSGDCPVLVAAVLGAIAVWQAGRARDLQKQLRDLQKQANQLAEAALIKGFGAKLHADRVVTLTLTPESASVWLHRVIDTTWHKNGTPVLRTTQTNSNQHGANSQVK